MWWQKYFILQCSAICVLQLIGTVSSQEFITRDELFAMLRNDDPPSTSTGLPEDLSVTSSTTKAPEILSTTNTPVQTSTESDVDSNNFKKTQIFEEKSISKARNNTSDGTETEFQTGSTIERKSFKNVSFNQGAQDRDFVDNTILENSNIPDIFKQRGIKAQDISKSFPDASDLAKQFGVNIPHSASDSDSFLANSNNNFNSPPHPSWTSTSSSDDNFTPSLPTFDTTNFNSPPRQFWTRTYSSKNNFGNPPFLENFNRNLNSPTQQTWYRTYSNRFNFDGTPDLPSFDANLNSPLRRTWTRTSSSGNNFESPPFTENFDMNFNDAPNRQSWTHTSSDRNTFDKFPTGFQTDDKFFNTNHGNMAGRATFGPVRSHNSGYYTTWMTDENGQTVKKTVRW